ncbi:uncharacterized protein LOC107305496 [Oryza brachyantha]|uniref:Uncharacterized protein n=1 Tax=Oryza brachyantha TaxID=4533 RepID=J3KUP7_ORYBR|nr:uncharacterized protein LOC107305496 [Oryza brachyantha]XP_015698957.1 uncharacterized protein LOC107305496 [Oryza brachyantha]
MSGTDPVVNQAPPEERESVDEEFSTALRNRHPSLSASPCINAIRLCDANCARHINRAISTLEPTDATARKAMATLRSDFMTEHLNLVDKFISYGADHIPDKFVMVQLSPVEPLDGTNNFSKWKSIVLLNLAILDCDLAIREDPPEEPQLDEKYPNYNDLKWAYDNKLTAWKKSNRLSLMYIKSNISPTIIGGITDSGDVKTYLANIKENFKTSHKAYVHRVIKRMMTSRYDGKSGIRKHILEMAHMAHELKTMGMEISDDFLVLLIISLLPPTYDPFRMRYCTKKENWTILELISNLVEEEECMKAEEQKHNNELNLLNPNTKGKRKFYQGEY